ncbi:MAG: RLF2 family protein, partial [Candidatus Phytoplasma australasiaticum]|nr:RLF2 family protein [Candidatus Phytoplasma australasiaticum]
FQSFFKKVSPNEKKNSKIGNFELQKDQSIALLVPDQVKESFCIGAFDSIISHQDTKILYLDEIRNKTRKPIKNKCLNKLKQKKDNDIIVENDQLDKKVYKAKLLQFHENNRPAYFGNLFY